jgi:hypothetical protein
MFFCTPVPLPSSLVPNQNEENTPCCEKETQLPPYSEKEPEMRLKNIAKNDRDNSLALR